MNTYSGAVQQGSVVVAVINNKIEQGTYLISIHSKHLKCKPSSLYNLEGNFIFRINPKAISFGVLDGADFWVEEINREHYLSCHNKIKLGKLIFFEANINLQ